MVFWRSPYRCVWYSWSTWGQRWRPFYSRLHDLYSWRHTGESIQRARTMYMTFVYLLPILIAGLAVSFPTHLLLESCDVTWWAWLLLHLLLPHSDGSLTALSVCCVPTHGDPVRHLGAAHQSWNDLGIPLSSCLDCVGIPDSIKSLGQLKHWDESLLAQIRDILCYCTVIYPVMTLCMTLDYTHIGALVPFLGHQYKAVYITDTVSEDMWYALQYNTIDLLGLGVDQMLRRFPLES